MKSQLTIECDFLEERDTLKTIIYAADYASMLNEAREEIRARLKWGEDVSQEEERFLERLRETIYHDSLDY